MSEEYIQLPPDSTGKKLRSIEMTIGANTVQHEVMVIADSNGTVINPLSENGTVTFTNTISLGTVEISNPVNTIEISNPVNTISVSNSYGTVNVSNYTGTVSVSNLYGTVEVSNPVGTLIISSATLPAIVISSATLAANQWINMTSGTIGNTVLVREQGPTTLATNQAIYVTSATIGNTVSINIQPGIGIHCTSINVGNSTVAVVGAVASKMIKVYNILIVANAPSTIFWSSNSTLVSGTLIADTIGWGYAQVINPPAYLLTSAAGATLNLTCLGGTIGGYLSYWDDDAT